MRRQPSDLTSRYPKPLLREHTLESPKQSSLLPKHVSPYSSVLCEVLGSFGKESDAFLHHTSVFACPGPVFHRYQSKVGRTACSKAKHRRSRVWRLEGKDPGFPVESRKHDGAPDDRKQLNIPADTGASGADEKQGRAATRRPERPNV